MITTAVVLQHRQVKTLNNKLRANKWERDAARLLSLLISCGQRKDLFWRTNSSGAKFTQTGEKQHAGDIVAACAEVSGFAEQFLIEAKWKKDFCFCDTSTTVRWMEKYGVQASEIGKSPLLLVKGQKGKVYLLSLQDREEFLIGITPENGAHMLVDSKYVVAEVNRTPVL